MGWDRLLPASRRGRENSSADSRPPAELLRAARDPRVRALVFRVNSPGGSAVGSDLVWRAVKEVQRRGKPVVVSMGDVAGSGGYYVAMAADAIVAQPATVTGSIGVVYTKFNAAGLWSVPESMWTSRRPLRSATRFR